MVVVWGRRGGLCFLGALRRRRPGGSNGVVLVRSVLDLFSQFQVSAGVCRCLRRLPVEFLVCSVGELATCRSEFLL